ncbi:Rad17 cell cycle checkpoint protein-domain-containing protein [Syncephalastrum racemosum]|uniref:Rad17 cell cycle checkpoint protein-domain-containing protein n=1 Tax=Syncephalastrum racemosum TaxID=13706 RepID=A0A1X2HRV6_SYNRA|nr:Rad17 cell cycle checkpoint protein-domain-containing protein [Syncephalastrum racemosum]
MDGLPFVLPTRSTQPKKKPVRNPSTLPVVDPRDQDCPWAEKYTPKAETELCVASNRIVEVAALLEPTAPQKCLILHGQSGGGKSTMLRVMARARHLDLVEWNPGLKEQWNPQTADDYQSMMHVFEEFLLKSIQYSPLKSTQRRKKRIILLDDLPDLLYEASKDKFHALLHQALLSPEPILLCIVYSDASIYEPSRRLQTRDARPLSLNEIVPAAIQEHPLCSVIEVRPVVPTRMKQALRRIQQAERSHLSAEQIVDIMDQASGDIRSAINNMQFHSVRIPPSANKGKRRLDQENEMQESSQGSTLSIFHAIGKVLYCKRDADGEMEATPEDILRRLPTDSDHFVAHLHANLLHFQSTTEQMDVSYRYLSDADLLSAQGDWRDPAPYEYQALVAMRGIMKTDPKPTNRRFYQMQKPSRMHTRIPTLREVTSVMGTYPLQQEQTTESMDMDEDEIESFSDEDEGKTQMMEASDEFDDLFGDGADLAALPDI